MAQRSCALRSLSEKYQWPEEGIERFDSSPSTQITAMPCSSSRRTSRLSREAVYTFRSGGTPGRVGWEGMGFTISRVPGAGGRRSRSSFAGKAGDAYNRALHISGAGPIGGEKPAPDRQTGGP